MQDKKKKKDIKIRDLKPSKDAKGGATSPNINKPMPTIIVNGR